MTTTRKALANVDPATIWRTCFVPMKWETWDPDVNKLENVKGGCTEGATFDYVMKDGMRAKATLSDVVENRSLTFSGSLMGGLVGFQGILRLIPKDDANTEIEYEFGMKGFLGSIAGYFSKTKIVHGVEEGLRRIVNIAEASGGAATGHS